jgi:hypothetical protein
MGKEYHMRVFRGNTTRFALQTRRIQYGLCGLDLGFLAGTAAAAVPRISNGLRFAAFNPHNM